MTFGQALRWSLRPALIAGPISGIATFFAIILLVMLFDDNGAEMIFLMAIGAVFAALLGLIIATPLSLFCSATMLRQIARNPRWARRRYWIAVGAPVGIVVVSIFWALSAEGSDSTVGSFVAVAAFGAFAGGCAAWANRAMLKSAIAQLTSGIDTDIFA